MQDLGNIALERGANHDASWILANLQLAAADALRPVALSDCAHVIPLILQAI